MKKLGNNMSKTDDKNLLIVTLLSRRLGIDLSILNEIYEKSKNIDDYVYNTMKYIQVKFFYEFKLYILPELADNDIYTNLMEYIMEYEIDYNINTKKLDFGNKLNEIFSYDLISLEKTNIIDLTIYYDMWINEYLFFNKFLDRN